MRGVELQFAEISFGYGGAQILSAIDLTIALGETVSIVGPSGCGKSTFLKLAAGLLDPTSGSVTRRTRSGQPMRIGLAPQHPTLLPWLDLFENVSLPTRLGPTPREDRSEVASLLSLLGLEAWSRAAPSALSGGMQSRAALARALVGDIDLLLLDEPFSSLDEVTSEAVLVDLDRLLEMKRPTTLFVSHNLQQAVLLSDRVVVLSSAPARVRGIVEVALPHPRVDQMAGASALGVAIARVRELMRDAA